MNDTLDNVTIPLPLRLLPRRGGQFFKIIFFMFFFCFSVFWIVMASGILFGGNFDNAPFTGFRYVFPAFGLPFVAVGALGLASSIAKLLPGSPYFHVMLAADGVTQRSAWKTRRFAWSELSPFAVSIRVTRNKGGTTTRYWVVALRPVDADKLAVESERYRRSILRIDAGDYGEGDGEISSASLADWLNELRTRALEHPARAGDETVVPPEFRDGVIALGPVPRPASSVATTPRRSGVIER